MPRKTRAKNEQPPNIKKEDGHIKKAGQKRPYQCQLCEKSYQTNAILHSHFNTHTDKYKCDVCGRKNRSSTALNIHRRIHTGEKPFGCQKCDYSASDKSSLRQHLLTCKGAKKEVRMQSVSRDVTLEDSMRDYRPLRDVELEEEVDDYLQLYSPFGKAYVPSSAALPPLREPAHDHFRPSAELFQPDWTDNGNQPERFEGYDPGHVEEPRAFQTKGFEFARHFRRKASNSPAVAKTRSDTGLHVKMDRMMQEIKALSIKSSDGMNCLVEGLQKQNEYLMQENEKIGRAHQEAMESVLKMSDKFDQALELLKQHQNIPRPRRVISSASSDDESDENTPQDGRPKHRKTRRQRKKLISKKKEPQESEGEFITPINFNLAERCVFCWQNDHSSDDCSNYSRMKWRVGIKNFRMLCSLCLCFHPSRICFQPPTCPYCRDTDHHPAICPSDAHMAFLEQLAAAANES